MTTLLWYLLVTLFFVFPFGQITRIPVSFSPEVHLYLHDILVFIIAVTFTTYKLKNKNRILPPFTKAFFLFVLVCLLSLFVNITSLPFFDVFKGSLYLFRFILYFFVYLAVYGLVSINKIKPKSFFLLLYLAGSVTAFLGLVQYSLYPNLRNLLYLGWDPHEARVFGTFFDSGYIGLVLVLTLLLVPFIWEKYRDTRFIRKFAVVSTGVIAYIAFALTYSRASYASFIAGFSVYETLSRSFKTLFVILFLFALTILVLPQNNPTSEAVKLGRTSTVTSRISNGKETFLIGLEKPILGVGFNTLRYVRRENETVPLYEWQENHAAAGADNSFVFVFATTGFLGIFAFCYLLFKAVKEGARDIMKKKITAVTVILLSSMAAIIVHSLFNNSLFYPWIMMWMWVLLGVEHGSRHHRRVSG